MPYNGYENYQTWCVSLWLDNKQGDYEYWQQRAEEIAESVDAGEVSQVNDGIWTKERAVKYLLTNEIKEAIGDTDNPLADQADMYSDLLNNALDLVNWHEVAKSFAEGLE